MDSSTYFFAYFSLVASIFSLLIGIYTAYKYPRISLIQIFFITCIFLSAINFIEFKLRISQTEIDAFLWSRLYAIWPFIITTALHFILIFRKEITHKLGVITAIYLPALVVFYIELTSEHISQKPILTEWGYTILPTSTNWSYASLLWTIIILALILYHAYTNYKLSIGNKKKQALLILVGLLLNFMIGISTDLLFKIFHINSPSIGYSYSIISFGLIAFAIKKYHLFEITPESIAGKILSTIQEVVFLINSKKQIVEINESALEILEYEREEIIGKNIDLIFLHSSKICDTCCNTKKPHLAKEIDAFLITSHGVKIPVSLSCTPIYLDNNKDAGTVFIGRDTTEQKNYEAQLKNTNSKLEDLISKRTENLSKTNSRLLTEIGKYEKTEKKLLQTIQKLEENERSNISFFDNLAHEISTPTNAIVGFTDLLLEENEVPKEDTVNYLHIIQNASKQLQGIVKNVVGLAKINNKKEKVILEDVNCNYILQSLYNQFIPLSKKHHLEFSCFKKLRDDEAIINTDQIKLTQILSNLLTNAFKFTHEGFIHFGYTVSVNKITFFVRDTGIGVTEENKKIIFERFAQGNNVISELKNGSGLGLSIAKTYVTLLGGDIWVESNETTKGSNFYFWLPFHYKTEEIHSDL